MATLPASGYLSDAARTKAEQKVAFEDQRDFIEQGPGGRAISATVISAGTITPTRAMQQVQTEAGAANDYLDNIDTTNLADGSWLLLRGSDIPGEEVTIRHQQGGAGEIHLRLGETPGSTIDAFTLNTWESVILLYRFGADWYEAARFYDKTRFHARGGLGGEVPSLREHYGFGDVVTYDNADANLDAGKLGGLAAALYALKSDPVSDAETLDGIDSTGFVQIALTSEQTVGGNIRNDTGRFVARAVSGAAPGLELVIDDGAGTPPTSDQLRAILFVSEGTPDALTLRLYDTDGSTVLGQLRITDTGAIEFDDGLGGGFRDLWDAKTFNGSDEITVSGSRYTEFDHIIQPAADVPGFSGTLYWVAPKAMTWFSVNYNTVNDSGDVFLDPLEVTGPEAEYVAAHLMPRDPIAGPVGMIYKFAPLTPFAGKESLRFFGEYVTAHDPSYSFSTAFYPTLESTPIP